MTTRGTGGRLPTGRTLGGKQVVKEKEELNFKHVKCELAIRHPVENVKEEVGYMDLQFKGNERNGDINPRPVF